jgi:hypothetical protein
MESEAWCAALAARHAREAARMHEAAASACAVEDDALAP